MEAARRLALLPLVLLLAGAAAPAAAQGSFFADPPTLPAAPTSDLPTVALVAALPCGAAVPLAPVRQGDLIELRYEPVEVCVLPPPMPTLSIPLGVLPAGTYHLRLVDVHLPGQPHVDQEVDFQVAPSPCDVDPHAPSAPQRLCLQGGRFQVSVAWQAPDGRTGFGVPTPLTRDTGAFWFFEPGNRELMVKMLDACAVDGSFWFYAAGLTDVGVAIWVDDAQRGTLAARWTHESPLGQPFQPVADVHSFPCE